METARPLVARFACRAGQMDWPGHGLGSIRRLSLWQPGTADDDGVAWLIVAGMVSATDMRPPSPLLHSIGNRPILTRSPPPPRLGSNAIGRYPTYRRTPRNGRSGRSPL